MRTVRRHLSWVVCAWLVCQVSAVTAAPLLFANDALCTCPAEALGAACPMHHAHQNPGECVVRSAAPASTVTLASLIGSLGVIAPVQTTSTIVVPGELILPASAAVILRSDRPDSPPPRS
ncbi:MAG TPA: hypothetical protein VGJ39_04780 [Vicinamibacterales bacterium]